MRPCNADCQQHGAAMNLELWGCGWSAATCLPHLVCCTAVHLGLLHPLLAGVLTFVFCLCCRIPAALLSAECVGCVLQQVRHDPVHLCSRPGFVLHKSCYIRDRVALSCPRSHESAQRVEGRCQQRCTHSAAVAVQPLDICFVSFSSPSPDSFHVSPLHLTSAVCA
jgi:hypothetical protein